MLNLSIRLLLPQDVTEDYVGWFSDNDVIRFSDNQFNKFSIERQISYVQDCLENPDISLYGIFDNEIHIGNITLTGLSSKHKRAEISYVIGNKSYWGKGIASYAIKYIVREAKDQYCLNRIYAGVADKNVGSIKALEKNGFSFEGKQVKHLFYNESFHDQLNYGLVLD